MDFKSQLLDDMKTFHNAKEMAEKIEITYQGSRKVVAAILESAEEIARQKNDPAQGINEIDSILYVSLEEMGEIPEMLEIPEMSVSPAAGQRKRTAKRSSEKPIKR